MKRNILTLVIAFLFIAQLSAQRYTYKISGNVMDESGIPLVGATVTLSNNNGTFTDEKGYYQLVSTQQHFLVTVSYIGYQTIQKEVNFEKVGRLKKKGFNFTLLPRVEQIAEIEVTEERLKEVFADPKYVLFDFELIGEDILVLLKRGRKRILRVQNDNGDVLHELALSHKAEHLQKGCYGGYHAIAQDSTLQVYWDQDSLHTIADYPTALFKKYIEPCITSIDSTLVFREEKNHNKLIHYYAVSQDNSQPKTIATVYDEMGATYAQETYSAIIHHYHRTVGGSINIITNGLWSGDVVDLVTDYTSLQMISWYRNIESKPASAPILNCKNQLHLFDHINNRLQRFDQDFQMEEATPIAYHLDKQFKKKYLWDEVQERCYAVFRQKGHILIKEINLASGEIMKDVLLKNHVMFPKKLQVRDGYLYFIGNDNGYTHKYKIYRVLL